ncbi:MAG: nuclease-related domain-containing protein [Streptosporangiaceae bacterium]
MARYRALSDARPAEGAVVSLALGVSALVVVGGLASWPVGAVLGVAVCAAHLVHRRIRPGPAGDWRRGALAERRTARSLAALDPRAYRVLHDRSLQGLPETNLDHLVIGLTGVYAVVSRRVRRGARLWADEGRLWAGGDAVSGLESTAALAALVVARMLSAELDRDVEVAAVVAVQAGRVPAEGIEYGGVVFHRGSDVTTFVKGRPVIFTSAQVLTIAAIAEEIFPGMNGCSQAST